MEIVVSAISRQGAALASRAVDWKLAEENFSDGKLASTVSLKLKRFGGAGASVFNFSVQILPMSHFSV